MSAENWLTRSSGLVVPAMGFANPLGRFQPCGSGEDCCEEIIDCNICDNDAMPQQLDVTVSGVLNAGCDGSIPEFTPSCDTVFNKTHRLNVTTPCNWEIDLNLCPLLTLGAFVRAQLQQIDGRLIVFLGYASAGSNFHNVTYGLVGVPTDCLSWTDISLSFILEVHDLGANACNLNFPVGGLTISVSAV